jgi:cytochrome P450
MSSALHDAARDLAERFDLRALPPEFYADPFPYYHALRRHAPVKRMPDGAYLLTRYADVLGVYKDPLAFSSDKKAEFKPKYGDSPLYEHHTTSLVFNDPPLHTRVRRLILGALTPRAIEGMEPALVALVEGLLDRMAGKREVDLVEDFAAAIPIEIVGNLLGVPHAERGPLRGWSLAILGALEPALSAEQLERGNRAVREFLAYLERLIAERTVHPGDPERDVLTRLIHGEVDGERLTHRAAAPMRVPAQRGTRDHHQSDRQRAARAHRVAGGEGQADRPARADPQRSRGVPALRKLEPARQPHRHLRHRSRRRRAVRRHADHPLHRRRQPRSRAVSRPGPAGRCT